MAEADRTTARRTAAPDAGHTLAGDRVVRVPDRQGISDVRLPAAEAVDAEGSAGERQPGEPEREIQCWLFRPAEEPVEVTSDAVPRLVANDENFVWVDLSGYTEDDLRNHAKLVGLHEGAIRSALAPWHRPRLAVFPGHFFVTATIPLPAKGAHRIGASQLDLFVGNNFLVSAHKQPIPFTEHLRARAYHSPDLVGLDSAYMLYLVLDETLAYYQELDQLVQDDIQRLEERALRDRSERFLEDLLSFKRYIYALNQLAEQHHDVFTAFLRPDFPWVAGKEVEGYFRDLESRLARVMDLFRAHREAVNDAFDIYVSHMTHRTNQVIKALTILSAVLFSATLIQSIFGTSLATSIQTLPVKTPLGFLLMCVMMVVTSIAILWTFHRKGWL